MGSTRFDHPVKRNTGGTAHETLRDLDCPSGARAGRLRSEGAHVRAPFQRSCTIGCTDPMTAYIFQVGVAGMFGESPTWWNVAHPTTASAMEAVVSGSPLWTVGAFRLTPTDAKLVKALWNPGTFVLTPVEEAEDLQTLGQVTGDSRGQGHRFEADRLSLRL